MYSNLLLSHYISVPGAPELTSVLPYYDSNSRELKKIIIQIMTDSSVSSYMIKKVKPI